MIRIFDILISLLVIILLSPLLVTVALLNLCTGEHEVFYFQKRFTDDGREFFIIKFATMVKDSPNIGAKGFVEKNDPRLLPLGGFLRKTKINELPQLINVLIGEMSLVGPRPVTEQTYNKIELLRRERSNSYPPGITSLASIAFRDEEKILANASNKEELYYSKILPLKVSFDDWWGDNRNLYNYCIILVLTFFSLFIQPNKLPFKLIRNIDPKLLDVLENTSDYL